MNRLKFFTLIFFVGFCNFLFCQKNLEDVVYTNDGAIFRGTIIEQFPDSILKIQIVGGSVIVCSVDKILKIEKEEIFQTSEYPFSHPKGYFNATSIGLLIGNPNETLNHFFLGGSFQTINGYQINPHLAIGLATCAETIGYQMVNCMLYTQINILPTGFSPYIYAESGLNFLTYHEETFWQIIDGKYGNSTGVGVGFRFNSQARIATTISFGYKRNTYSIETFDAFSQLLNSQFYVSNRYLLQLGFTM